MVPFTIPQIDTGAWLGFLRSLITPASKKARAIGEVEASFARLAGTRHAVLLSSGRYALYLLYRYGGCSGYRVVAPPYTCIPAIDAIRWAGARPVFVDIALHTYNLQFHPDLASRTDIRAVCLSYLYGLVDDPAPFLDWARRRNVLVIEDAAIALGARIHGRMAGSIGDAGIFSLQSSKIVSAWRGGVVTTDNPELVEFLRDQRKQLPPCGSWKMIFNTVLMALRRGLAHPTLYRASFYNLRRLSLKPWAARILRPLLQQDPSEATRGISPRDLPPSEAVRFSPAQAALVTPSLARLEEILGARREIARHYSQSLQGIGGLILPPLIPGLDHAYGRFPVRIPGISKQDAALHLALRGVEVGLYYPYLIPETQHFRQGARTGVEKGAFEVLGNLTNARVAAEETFLLPLHTCLRRRDLDRVADAVGAVAEEHARGRLAQISMA